MSEETALCISSLSRCSWGTQDGFQFWQSHMCCNSYLSIRLCLEQANFSSGLDIFFFLPEIWVLPDFFWFPKGTPCWWTGHLEGTATGKQDTPQRVQLSYALMVWFPVSLLLGGLVSKKHSEVTEQPVWGSLLMPIKVTRHTDPVRLCSFWWKLMDNYSWNFLESLLLPKPICLNSC